MPDPTPLSPLAGIEQMLRTDAESSRDNGFPVSAGHYDRAADYLAGLGKVLAEWREAFGAVADDTSEHVLARRDAAEIALYTYLTSPRETGKEKE